MDTHTSTLKEFILLLLASLAPIILLSLGLKLKNDEVSFFYSILTTLLKDSIFAYTSTMIAAFFVLLYKQESRLRFRWILVLVSIGVWSFSSVIFFIDKTAEANYSSNLNLYDFRNISSLSCYVISLAVWYYTIYTGYKPSESAEENLSKNRKKLMSAANKVK